MINLINASKAYHGFKSPIYRIINGLSFGYLGLNYNYKALKSITLQLNKGEIIGIIGRNGAGKSTLLKIISGVLKLDSGSLKISGKVRAILELGVGFSPELSGEENIFYNGIIWGMNPSEVKKNLFQIFEFANLSEFQKVPLKNYSTGMVMKLAFSLATFERPDILLIDESLTVGDAIFQQKCLKRIQEFKKEGTLIVVVSHDLNLLRSISDRMILLENGKLVLFGDVTHTIQKYMQIIANGDHESTNTKMLANNQTVDFVVSKILFDQIENPPLLFIGSKIKLIFQIQLKKQISDFTVGFHIDNSNGVRVFGTNTYLLNYPLKFDSEKFEIVFEFPINFAVGKYTIGLSIHEGENHSESCYLWEDGILSFEVERKEQSKFDGIVYLPIDVKTYSKDN